MQCLAIVSKRQNMRHISADALYYHLKQACGLSSRTFLSILRGLCDLRDKDNIGLDAERLLNALSLDAVMQLCEDSHIDMAIRKDIISKLNQLPDFSREAWRVNRLPPSTYRAYNKKMQSWKRCLM